MVIGNGVRGHSVGLEAWAGHQIDPRWRVMAGLSLLKQRLSFVPESTDPGPAALGANDPRHQLQLRSSWTLPRSLSLDVGVRAVGALPSPAVPAYTTVDARLGWSPRADLELSLAGFNLLDDRHPEFGAAPGRSELGRRLVLRAIWSL
jgi:iron complex outermembrane receptor protein